MKTLLEWLRTYSLFLAWIIAFIGAAATLVAEYGFGLTPGMLAWSQRVFVYPQVIPLPFAAYRNAARVKPYVLPLSVLGMIFALYHYLEQKVPALKDAIRCTTGVPCSGHYINWLGFITIPLLSLLGFTLITALLIIRRES